MADLTIVGSITRALLPGPPADLSLEQPGVYRIVSAGPGGRVWVRTRAGAQWVDGEELTSSRRSKELAALQVRVYGSTAAALKANTDTLLAAFDQWTYSLTLSIDGVANTWRCEMADYRPVPDEGSGEGTFGKFSFIAHQQLYGFSIPRHPVPIAGPL